MLTLIIPKKELVTSSNVDVYLQPLVDELHVLWKGVKAWDTYLGASFSLRTMCMWNIHDFPSYALFVGCVTKVQTGCPPCGPTIEFHFVRKPQKIVYCGSRHYLPNNHLY
jgi:hypothetical protein